MSLRIKEKVNKVRRSLSWNSNRNEIPLTVKSIRRTITGEADSFYDNALPIGWESAIDKDGRVYYVNHEDKISTYEDPRLQLEDVEYEYPETRVITLHRDSHLGFGFVAGSERPVVVRCVTEGGPSDSFLLPGDQIHKINGEDVRQAPRTRVIELVQLTSEELILTVSQPPTISTQGKKSILLNAAKKQQRPRRDLSASRVRFLEDPAGNKMEICPISIQEPSTPTLSNVLKVYIEVNQTRSFKFDECTLVKDVLQALQQKLDIRCIEHFSLVLQNCNSPLSAKMMIISPNELVSKIAGVVQDESVKCLFRLVYVPKDAYDLLRKDAAAFSYFYNQCCQDVINERFSSDLKVDVALRLASLHMLDHVLENHVPFNKINIKLIEKNFGFDLFINPSMIRAIKPKELRKMLDHYMKLNQELTAPGQDQVAPLQAKLQYMKIISNVRSFGSKQFLATLVDRHVEVMLLVGPKCGISQVTDIKSHSLHMLADFDLISNMDVELEPSGVTTLISIYHTDSTLPTLQLSMMNEEAKDFHVFVKGYHKLFCGNSELTDDKIRINTDTLKRATSQKSQPHTPPTIAKHLKLGHDEDEPDYATIEETVQSAESYTHPSSPVKPALPAKPILKNRNSSVPVVIESILSAPMQTPSQDENVAETNHSLLTSANTLKSSALPDIELKSEPTCEIPASYSCTITCIDDVIEGAYDEPLQTSPMPPGHDQQNSEINKDNLTEEFMNELSLLEDSGFILDSRLFNDKGLYISPQLSSAVLDLDLSQIPPPEELSPIAASPEVAPPPPPLFDDHETEIIEYNIGDLNKQTDKDKESGIDSDDSSADSYNYSSAVHPLERNSFSAPILHSNPALVISTTTRPQAASNLLSENSRKDSQHIPATSLRSRMNEQRETLKFSASIVIEDTITSPKPATDGTEKRKSSSSSFTDALVKLSGEISTDSDSDSEETTLSAINQLKQENSATSDQSISQVALEKVYTEKITSEIDQTLKNEISEHWVMELADNTVTESVYMNSEVSIDRPPALKKGSEASVAIDEALNSLRFDSESEDGAQLPGLLVEPEKIKATVSEQRNKSEATAERFPELSNSANQRTFSGSSATIPSDSPDTLSLTSTPRPPPRRRKGMPGSQSTSSLHSMSSQGSSPRLYDNVLPATIDHNRKIEGSPTQQISRAGSTDSTVNENSTRSPRPNSTISTNPISNDLGLLKLRANKKDKAERAKLSASVIGFPTNVSSTASEILANCIPINNKNPLSSSQSVVDVKLTPRESLLEEILKNAADLGITTLGIETCKLPIEELPRMRQDSLRSNESRSSLQTPRPSYPPPSPPAQNSVLDVRLSETMVELEYTTVNNTIPPHNKSLHNIIPADSKTLNNTTPSDSKTLPSEKMLMEKATEDQSSKSKSANGQSSLLESDGSFIKFSGYSGEPSAPDIRSSRGRFQKRQQRPILSSIVVDENSNKRGVIAKIFNSIKPKRRSLSLDRVTIETGRTHFESSSVIVSPEPANRPSIIPSGQGNRSQIFRSLGKNKLNTKSKSSTSLTDLLSEDPKPASADNSPGITLTSYSILPSRSTEQLLDTADPSKDEGAIEVEELYTSGSKINPKGLLAYTYDSRNAFPEATQHARKLLEHFQTYCDTQWAPCLQGDANAFTRIMESLVSEGRQFIANSKQLVAGVAQANGPTDGFLVSKMAASIRTFAKIVNEGIDALKITSSDYVMTSIYESISTVGEAYYDVLVTAHKAAGKSMQDENMMVIMQKASHLASLLSLFMKTLRTLHTNS